MYLIVRKVLPICFPVFSSLNLPTQGPQQMNPVKVLRFVRPNIHFNLLTRFICGMGMSHFPLCKKNIAFIQAAIMSFPKHTWQNKLVQNNFMGDRNLLWCENIIEVLLFMVRRPYCKIMHLITDWLTGNIYYLSGVE